MSRSRRSGSRADPGVAAVLSFFVPGAGQIYTGHWVWAIFWLVITPGFWLGTGGLAGWICHILSAMQAAAQARRRS